MSHTPSGKPFGKPAYARNDIMDYYSDFWAAKLDLAGGKQVWSYQVQYIASYHLVYIKYNAEVNARSADGDVLQAQSSKQDYFSSASVDPTSGDLIVTGTTQGTYSCVDSCQWQAGSVVILPDIVAARLDKTTGNTTWTFQDVSTGCSYACASPSFVHELSML